MDLCQPKSTYNISEEHNAEELQWLEHLWNYKKMFETGVVRANEH